MIVSNSFCKSAQEGVSLDRCEAIQPVIIDSAVVEELTPSSKVPAGVFSVFCGDAVELGVNCLRQCISEEMLSVRSCKVNDLGICEGYIVCNRKSMVLSER